MEDVLNSSGYVLKVIYLFEGFKIRSGKVFRVIIDSLIGWLQSAM